jgi:acyl-CoA thioesterase
VQVEVLRRGRSVSTCAARLIQHGEVVAHAVGVLAASRGDHAAQLGLEPPAMRPWRDVPVVPVGPPQAPVFAQHCEFRPEGAPPFSGVPEAMACGWVRLHRPGPVRDAAELIALADVWWPAHFASLTAPQAIGTVTFTLDLVGDVTVGNHEAPVYHRGRILAGQQGYLVEQRELWSEQGHLLAINQQTIAQLG